MSDKFIVIDPEEEYIDLAKDKHINGNVLDCSDDNKTRINPLQIRMTSGVMEQALEPEERIKIMRS